MSVNCSLPKQNIFQIEQRSPSKRKLNNPKVCEKTYNHKFIRNYLHTQNQQ